MNGVVKIYPTIEQCEINNNVKCPIENCNKNFTSESNLNLHITKTHNKTNLQSSPNEKCYFCPKISCSWNSTKYFKNMKNLRQHYLKVHKAKNFSCLICLKAFATETLLATHKEFCKVKFTCLDCKAAYDCYDTLKTHSRRKRHKILEKCHYKYKNIVRNGSILKTLSPRALLVLINVDKPSTNNQRNKMTNKPIPQSKMTQVTNYFNKVLMSHNTQQTQTSSSRNVFLSVQTQTNSKNISDVKPCKVSLMENCKNINTQTDAIQSKEISCNTSFTLEDFDLSFGTGNNINIEKNTSSTQTSVPQDIFSTTASTSLVPDSSNTLDSFVSDFNCNSMETQTDFMFENDIFNNDYYTNMYTQTCDDLLNSLNNYNDNQTQTQSCFDEDDSLLLHSVHSQTLMTSLDSQSSLNIIKDIVHSETQTDEEFRQMLEIINS